MKRILFTILGSLLFAASFAIPAKPGFVDFTQPDGSVIKIMIQGDEHGHSLFSESGMLLVEVGGRLEYACFDSNGFPVPSGVIASLENEPKFRSIQRQPQSKLDRWASMLSDNKAARIERLTKSLVAAPGITRADDPDSDSPDSAKIVLPQNFGRYNVTYPVLGEQKAIVILVQYPDVEFKFGDYDYFSRMLNEEGFSDYGSLGSARDWFVENSDGKFLPDFDVYGPVTLPQNRSYYGENDVFGNDKRPWDMVVDACDILKDEVDFSQYDRDGDGEIDNVFLFYAGKGEHDSQIKNAVWPHSYELNAAYPDTTFIYNGVRLNKYGCTCEYPSGYKRPDGIGTFVHEFSHVMGLPDLYVTDYGGGFTPDAWSVLDQGPYNNDRLTPPNYSSYEKASLGWIDFLPMPEGEVQIPDFATSNIAYALPTDNENEFYFFENRQQIGNDAFIPGHGMLVWHVDYDEDIWTLNIVNNKKTHHYVDLIEADNIKSNSTRSGDAFPGTANVTSFGFSTSPKLASWSGAPLAFNLEDIAETEDGLITFKAVLNVPDAVKTVEVETAEAENVYYDLTGRRVANPSKGIYILNCKKIIR